MFVYKISELLESLQSARSDGFDYVSLSLLEPDENDDELNYKTLVLDYIHDASDSEEDMIDSISLPEGYHHN
mgnify:FL=1